MDQDGIRDLALTVSGEELRDAPFRCSGGNRPQRAREVDGLRHRLHPGGGGSAAKMRPAEEFAVHASLVGNAIQVRVFEWAFSHLVADLWYLERPPTRLELCNGAMRTLVVWSSPGLGSSCGNHERTCTAEQRLVAVLTARAGTKGSYVRMSTSEFLLPSSMRFQSTRSNWWLWKEAFGTSGRTPCKSTNWK